MTCGEFISRVSGVLNKLERACEMNVREGNDAVQQPDPHPNFPDVGDLGDAGNDERVECAREESIENGVEHDLSGAFCEYPENRRAQSGKKNRWDE